jgi:hypothetical protein
LVAGAGCIALRCASSSLVTSAVRRNGFARPAPLSRSASWRKVRPSLGAVTLIRELMMEHFFVPFLVPAFGAT